MDNNGITTALAAAKEEVTAGVKEVVGSVAAHGVAGAVGLGSSDHATVAASSSSSNTNSNGAARNAYVTPAGGNAGEWRGCHHYGLHSGCEGALVKCGGAAGTS